MNEGLMDDPRPIKSIYWSEGSFTVGTSGITKIETYREHGQMSYVPWFMIWRGDHVWQRVNGALVEGVEYHPPVTSVISRGAENTNLLPDAHIDHPRHEPDADGNAVAVQCDLPEQEK